MATQYVMKATRISTNKTVNWVVTGSPDLVGTYSGITISDLSGIAIEYSTDLPTSTTGGQIIGQNAWTSVYDAVFSSLTAQTFSADGNVTIDGKTWTVINKANADTIAIDSTGLVFDCNATNSNYTGSTRTAPGIFSRLTNFIDNLDMATKFRIWVWNSSNTADQDTEQAFVSLEKTTQQNYVYKRGFSTTTRHSWDRNSNATNYSDGYDTANFSEDVMIMEFDGLGSRGWKAYSGTYSSGQWPAIASCRLRRDFAWNEFNTNLSTFMEVVSDGYVFLGAFSGNTNNNFVSKFGRFKIEVLNQTSAQSGTNLNLVDTYARRPSLATTGQSYMCTDGPEFIWDGTLWRPKFTRGMGYEPPNPNGWTWENQGTSTATFSKGRIDFFGQTTGGSIHSRNVYTSLSGATSVVGKLAPINDKAGGASQFPLFGIMLRENSSGKFLVLALAISNSAGQGDMTTYIGGAYWTSTTVRVGGSVKDMAGSHDVWLKLDASTSTILGQLSSDPNDSTSWVTVYSVAKTTAFTTAPDQYGLSALPFGNDVYGKVLSLKAI